MRKKEKGEDINNNKTTTREETQPHQTTLRTDTMAIQQSERVIKQHLSFNSKRQGIHMQDNIIQKPSRARRIQVNRIR